MTDVIALMDVFAAAFLGATAAGERVYVPRTWPTEPGTMPLIVLEPGKETQRSKGRSVPQFDVVGGVRARGRVYAKSGAGDAGAIAALAAACILKRQMEVAIVGRRELRLLVQSVATVETTVTIGREGEVVFGEVLMEFGLDYYRGPDEFHPTGGDPLEELALYADLLNVFSSTGDFTGQPDATPFVADAAPAPRDAGPDGRAEGAFIVPLPQP